MDVATQIILQWVLAVKEIDALEAKTLVATLDAGEQAMEKDSLQLIEELVHLAEITPKAPPYHEIISAAIRLRHEIRELNVAGDAIQKLIDIKDLTSAIPDDILGQRILAKKLGELIEKRT